MAMIIIFVFIFIINLSNCNVVPESDDKDLKLVHVFFRHGARTPDNTYPKDIYVNETFKPYGLGQLTNIGKEEMYELGHFLRRRYHNYLSPTLNLSDIYAQSTDYPRTKMSLELVLASLYPPKNTPLEWNKKLNWQPIPYNYEPYSQDSLLLVLKPCPKYNEEYQRVVQQDDLWNSYANIFNELSNLTGTKIQTPIDLMNLYATLKAEKEYGFTLPKWTINYFPKGIKYLAAKSYEYLTYTTQLKRFIGGVFLKKAISDWKSKIDNKISQKIFVYSAHDVTVVNILSALNVWETQYPDYAITGILEFSQNRKTKQYGVEIFLKRLNEKVPIQLVIPGCSKFCELSRLEDLLKANIPEDWNAECNANVTNPTVKPPF